MSTFAEYYNFPSFPLKYTFPSNQSRILGYGKPISQIQNLVKKENIDLVVASSRQADWEKRFFIRSVPQKLMLYLPCNETHPFFVSGWGKVLSFHDPLYQKATTMCLIAIIITQIANGAEDKNRQSEEIKYLLSIFDFIYKKCRIPAFKTFFLAKRLIFR
ncbi:MAG: universal stress protein [Candidatus Desulfofervidaceae bacterium]|nr:universal stress protein [Candidatus Desulfofervidaceae bacterium]